MGMNSFINLLIVFLYLGVSLGAFAEDVSPATKYEAQWRKNKAVCTEALLKYAWPAKGPERDLLMCGDECDGKCKREHKMSITEISNALTKSRTLFSGVGTLTERDKTFIVCLETCNTSCQETYSKYCSKPEGKVR